MYVRLCVCMCEYVYGMKNWMQMYVYNEYLREKIGLRNKNWHGIVLYIWHCMQVWFGFLSETVECVNGLPSYVEIGFHTVMSMRFTCIKRDLYLKETANGFNCIKWDLYFKGITYGFDLNKKNWVFYMKGIKRVLRNRILKSWLSLSLFKHH